MIFDVLGAQPRAEYGARLAGQLRSLFWAIREDEQVLEGLVASLGVFVVVDGLARLPGRGDGPAVAGEPVAAAELRDVHGRDYLSGGSRADVGDGLQVREVGVVREDFGHGRLELGLPLSEAMRRAKRLVWRISAATPCSEGCSPDIAFQRRSRCSRVAPCLREAARNASRPVSACSRVLRARRAFPRMQHATSKAG